MKALRVRPECREQDIRVGRQQLAAELGKSGKIVLVIRGNSPDSAQFVARTKDLTESVGWRELIWVVSEEILSAEQEVAWFGRDRRACAAVFDVSGNLVGHLRCDCSLYDIELLFLDAKCKKGSSFSDAYGSRGASSAPEGKKYHVVGDR